MAKQARPQVFINHGGNDLNNNFIRHVARALSNEGFNVFIDSDYRSERSIGHIFSAIENSKVALVIFSDRYAASEWCLHAAVKIYDRLREGKLVLIPVFYRVTTEEVNMFYGRFGECVVETLMKLGTKNHPFAKLWTDNVNMICTESGLVSEDYRSDASLVGAIVRTVKSRLQRRNMQTRKLRSRKLQSHQEGFGKELIYASIVALLCYFIIPFVFTDLDFFSFRQWFVVVLVWFVIRKSCC